MRKSRATGKCSIPRRITAEVKAGTAPPVKSVIRKGSCCLGNVNAAVKKSDETHGGRKPGSTPEIRRLLRTCSIHSFAPKQPTESQNRVNSGVAFRPSFLMCIRCTSTVLGLR